MSRRHRAAAEKEEERCTKQYKIQLGEGMQQVLSVSGMSLPHAYQAAQGRRGDIETAYQQNWKLAGVAHTLHKISKWAALIAGAWS